MSNSSHFLIQRGLELCSTKQKIQKKNQGICKVLSIVVRNCLVSLAKFQTCPTCQNVKKLTENFLKTCIKDAIFYNIVQKFSNIRSLGGWLMVWLFTQNYLIFSHPPVLLKFSKVISISILKYVYIQNENFCGYPTELLISQIYYEPGLKLCFENHIICKVFSVT